jgi:uncharacterized protein
MNFTALEWACLLFGALLAGASKGGLPGLNTAAVVLFAQAMSARAATGTLLPLLIAADIVAVTMFRRTANWRELLRLTPSTIIGVILGAWLLGRVDDSSSQRLIGAIILALCALQLWRSRDRDPNAGVAWLKAPATIATVGVLAGSTTMIANAAGPVMTLYLLAMRLPKLEFVGTTAWFFFAVNLFKLPFMVGLGLLNVASLELDAMLLPALLLGVLGGRFVLERLPQVWFERAAIIMAVIGGLRLLLG